MISRVLLSLCLVAIFVGSITVNAAPTEQNQTKNGEDDPVEKAVSSVGQKTLLLSQGLTDMYTRASQDGLDTSEMRSMCELFYREYKEIIRYMDELHDIAANNDVDIRVEVSREAAMGLLQKVLADIRMVPEELYELVFGTDGPLGNDDIKLEISMTMLRELSHMAGYEAKYNLLQADTIEEAQHSLDTILSIAGAIMEVTNGIMETISDADAQFEAIGSIPDSGEENTKEHLDNEGGYDITVVKNNNLKDNLKEENVLVGHLKRVRRGLCRRRYCGWSGSGGRLHWRSRSGRWGISIGFGK